MPNNKLDGDTYVAGELRCITFSAPAGCIGNVNITGSDPIDPSKVKQQYHRLHSQVHGSVATTERRPIHISNAVGLIYLIKAGLVIPCLGAATITVDLRKNGTTVMSAVITLNNTGVAYIPTTGTILTTDYVLNDVFELVITATAGGGTLGQGLFVEALFRELPG